MTLELVLAMPVDPAVLLRLGFASLCVVGFVVSCWLNFSMQIKHVFAFFSCISIATVIGMDILSHAPPIILPDMSNLVNITIIWPR